MRRDRAIGNNAFWEISEAGTGSLGKFIRHFLAAIGVGIIALAGTLASGLYSLPIGTVSAVDFTTLTLTQKPNQYLVCPDGFCRAAAHRVSPVYNMTATELRKRWLEWMAGLPKVILASANSDGFQVTFMERSQLMGFPDLITVQFVPADERQSAVAIYSRSLYGYSDLGVNRARIERWLSQFEG